MKSISAAALGGFVFLFLAGNAGAASSTRAEREETQELNAQQLQLARQQNAGLSINANSTATDAAAKLASNSPPAAAPTIPVLQAGGLPQAAMTPSGASSTGPDNPDR